MRKETLVAWSQFEMMMRTGVPHAMDIAAELVRYDLAVPLPTHMNNANRFAVLLRNPPRLSRPSAFQVLDSYGTVQAQFSVE